MTTHTDNLNYLSNSPSHAAWVKEADARVRALAQPFKAGLTLAAAFGFFAGVLYLLAG